MGGLSEGRRHRFVMRDFHQERVIPTPDRTESPGRLGDLPVEGPSSRWSVEAFLYGYHPGIGSTLDDLRQYYLHELDDKLWVQELVEDASSSLLE